MKRVVSAAIVLIGLATPAWADWDDGVAAYKRGDYATALRELLLPATQGNAWSQYSLGNMYANGDGVPQDYAEATKWWRKAASQGIAAAQFSLGFMYYNGRGVSQDYASGGDSNPEPSCYNW